MSILTENTPASLINVITCYLDLHPNAADTVEGITRWWLPEKYKLESINKVQAVLDLLIEQGVMEKRNTADGRVIFSGAKRSSS